MPYPDSNRARDHARILGLLLLAIACLLGEPAAAFTQGAQIQVTKVLVPASDPGRFDLLVGGLTQATNVGHLEGTGVFAVTPGPISVGEIAAAGTNLADYVSSIECSTLIPSSGPPQVVSCTNCTSLNLDLGFDSQTECTITNRRIPDPVPASGAVQLGVLMLALALASGWALRRRTPVA